ncbi:alpha/beta hydrolase family protein [Peribacillus kribbensis]|uniref:alpha/beta hydrolase family protein n=1 Tax=Peribacillus kribbensis TaxID=356658 RepID=UPI0003F9450F|nr:prolyl oligopeptidase family serine peptidase [Peribacillus kribbensis]
MSFIHTEIAGIPCFHIQPEGTGKNAMLLLYHGWGTRAEDQAFLGNLLAKWGYEVIILEILYHDSRQCLSRHFRKDVMEKYFWKTILESVQEGENLARQLKKEKERKLVLLGSSMGGFIASGAFAQSPLYDGLININGSSAFEVSERIFQNQGSQAYPDQEEIRKYDPIQFLHELKDRSILLLHGKDDTSINPAGQQAFFEAARRVTNQVQLELFSNVNHTITLGMLEHTLAWLEEHFF